MQKANSLISQPTVICLEETGTQFYESTVFDLITAQTPYQRTVKQFRNLQLTTGVLFVYLFIKLYKGICCVYLFELHWLVNVIQMIPTAYAFKKKKNQKEKKIT